MRFHCNFRNKNRNFSCNLISLRRFSSISRLFNVFLMSLLFRNEEEHHIMKMLPDGMSHHMKICSAVIKKEIEPEKLSLELSNGVEIINMSWNGKLLLQNLKNVSRELQLFRLQPPKIAPARARKFQFSTFLSFTTRKILMSFSRKTNFHWDKSPLSSHPAFN